MCYDNYGNQFYINAYAMQYRNMIRLIPMQPLTTVFVYISVTMDPTGGANDHSVILKKTTKNN